MTFSRGNVTKGARSSSGLAGYFRGLSFRDVRVSTVARTILAFGWLEQCRFVDRHDEITMHAMRTLEATAGQKKESGKPWSRNCDWMD